jgi:hypothetical protein
MGEDKCLQILVVKPEGKKPHGRHRRRLEDTIKMYLHELGMWVISWIDLAQDMESWRALVNTLMKIRVL